MFIFNLKVDIYKENYLALTSLKIQQFHEVKGQTHI